MAPGSMQFRKHCERILPMRGGEQKAHYIGRLARHLGINQKRMHTLYYDQREDNATFRPDEHAKFFLRNPTRFNPEAKNHLDQLRIKLEEQSLNISRLERDLAKQNEFKRKLGEFLAAH